MATGCTVRDLRASDRAAWDALWQAYLDFYREDLDPAITDLTFARLLDPSHPFFGLVAEQGGVLVGLVNSLVHASTWSRQGYCYLEDLYVLPERRGHGVGKALLKHLAKLAVERGCARLEWSVLDWNTPAIDFYKSLGAEPQDEWTIFRVTGQALSDLAQ